MTRPYVTLLDLFAESPTNVAMESELGTKAAGSGPVVAETESAGEIGKVIADRYLVEAVIGEGGMGRVYRVRHTTLGKRFALKLMHAGLLGDARVRELFYREARLASSLSHPNIVSIVDFGEDAENRAYMVMELVEGEPLLRRMRQGHMSLRQVCDIIVQVAEALHYVHQRDIVHNDIKPENILICEEKGDGRRKLTIKLLDFGLARLGTGKSSQRLDGTPEYMAPEKIQGLPPHPSMDVYGLGILTYALLTGRLPFMGTIDEVLDGHLHKTPLAPSVVRGEPIDERAEALVMKALAKDPAERQKDMAAFVYEVKTLQDMLGFGRKRAAPASRQTGQHAKAEGRAEKAAAVFDLSPVPLAAVNVDGLVVIANRAFVQFVMGSPDLGMAGQDLVETQLGDICEGLASDLRRVHVQGTAVERRFQLKTAEGLPVDMVMLMSPGQPMRGDVHLAIYALHARRSTMQSGSAILRPDDDD